MSRYVDDCTAPAMFDEVSELEEVKECSTPFDESFDKT